MPILSESASVLNIVSMKFNVELHFLWCLLWILQNFMYMYVLPASIAWVDYGLYRKNQNLTSSGLRDIDDAMKTYFTTFIPLGIEFYKILP